MGKKEELRMTYKEEDNIVITLRSQLLVLVL